MELFIIIVQLVAGLGVLTLGADWLVRGSSNFALSIGIKPLIIGLTLVAFGTSAPELTVSVKGALDGNSGIAVGNVIGSNIANIGLILGLCAIIRPVDVSKELFRRDIPMMLVASVALGLLPFLGGPSPLGESVGFEFSRWKALVLLGLFLISLWLTFRNAGSSETPLDDVAQKISRTKNLLLALVGLGALIGGGYFFVEGAVSLAERLGIPQLVIGLTIVAVGTSLPEFATSIIAAIRGQSDISVGNVVGSNIFNILFVLGLSAAISPVMIEPKTLQMDIPVMLLMALLLPALAWRSRKLGRLGGAMLLAAYVLYSCNLFFNWV